MFVITPADLLDAGAVDSEVGVAGAGCGADVHQISLVVEKQFDVVDEAEHPAGELDVVVPVDLRDDLRPGHVMDHVVHIHSRVITVRVADRFDHVGGVGVVRADAVGRSGARVQPHVGHA